MPTVFDESEFPLVRMRVYGATSDADLNERLSKLEGFLGRREKMALVFDSSGSQGLSAAQRKMWGDWLEKQDPFVRRYCVGCAIVVTSTFVRAVFTGVFWLWSPPVPYAFFASPSEADAWARARLG